jgi:DNA-binding response OmpR family regulator
MAANLLLVDDDVELTEMLGEYLENEGYSIAFADSGEAALARFDAGESFDLCVFDIMMPGISGLELLQQIRPKVSTPVIMLTGRGDDIDRILGLEMGADDYMPKPANPRELLARIKAVLRRSAPIEALKQAEEFSIAGILLNTQTRIATAKDQSLALTSAEFNVLHLLMEKAGTVVTKEWLTEQVLHRKLTAYDRSIDVHVSRVRAKLDQVEAGLADLIKTVRGEGYQLILPQGH